jgi:hypothetical protein
MVGISRFGFLILERWRNGLESIVLHVSFVMLAFNYVCLKLIVRLGVTSGYLSVSDGNIEIVPLHRAMVPAFIPKAAATI